MFVDGIKRIVVTGMGLVSSIGLNKDEFWENLKNGASGISEVEDFDTSGMERHRGGEIKNFDIEHFFPGNINLKNLGRAKQMTMVAAQECLKDAAFDIAKDRFRVGVAIGTTMGEAKSLETMTDKLVDKGIDGIALWESQDYPPYTIPQILAEEFKIYGPNIMLPNACAAGNFSVGYAIHSIHSGEVDAMIAGGADAFSRYAFSGFGRLGAISPDVPRPFSKGRKGMVPGEGAGCLFIEDYESALARGAKMYAEIVGFGESCDAHHITQPHDEGVSRAMNSAMKEAGISAQDLSYVSVHGTGTPTNDSTEARALHKAFGDDASSMAVSSVKSNIGHPMGAASAIECIAALLSMKHQYIPPTINHVEKDPECDVDCVANIGRKENIKYVMKTSSAFGGNNSSIIFKAI